MKVTETKDKHEEVVTDVICDCCGKSLKVKEGISDEHYGFEYMTLEATWGFFSEKDTEHWIADICEKCVDEKFTFVKFKKTNYL